ncbi:hypothetical protein CEXT_30561 [Caerostris extrusa]|uniref:Uncharacterized protein n=1 Tax=Caerostris extrusa TaxID=172846 RepID=A0AAV4MJ23_CAEEX|nr:hypothetical protein CEXT_30561 [Caerostris extrusa]
MKSKLIALLIKDAKSFPSGHPVNDLNCQCSLTTFQNAIFYSKQNSKTLATLPHPPNYQHGKSLHQATQLTTSTANVASQTFRTSSSTLTNSKTQAALPHPPSYQCMSAKLILFIRVHTFLLSGVINSEDFESRLNPPSSRYLDGLFSLKNCTDENEKDNLKALQNYPEKKLHSITSQRHI